MTVTDGRRRVSENVPSAAVSSTVSGSLVVSAPTEVRANALHQRAHRERVRAERRASCLSCGDPVSQAANGRPRLYCRHYCAVVEYRARKRAAA